jgi:protein-S-isoprenylcysteine O-methyltransferase Ste14
LGQSVLMLAVFLLAVLMHGGGTNLFVIVCGGLLMAIGGVCGIAGVIALGRSLTPLPTPTEDTRLVQRGIYGLMRHPLYTSVILASVGWALLWQSWPALLPALGLAPFFSAKACREERWLRERFPDYSDYERRVSRFIPGVY